MGANRTSRISEQVFTSVALVFLGSSLAACGGGFPTATEMPKVERRPDGVALDPPMAMPAISDRVEARGVVALREPLADKDVEDVVRAYLRGFEREDDQALAQLVAQEAASLGQPNSSRQQLIDGWRAKMRRFEYQKLAGIEVADLSQLERFPFEVLGTPGAPARPSEMRPGDLYVRVPIATPRVGAEQLFGDFLVLLLRHEDGRLKIAGQTDESSS